MLSVSQNTRSKRKANVEEYAYDPTGFTSRKRRNIQSTVKHAEQSYFSRNSGGGDYNYILHNHYRTDAMDEEMDMSPAPPSLSKLNISMDTSTSRGSTPITNPEEEDVNMEAEPQKQPSKQRMVIVMGYRTDCERCKNKEPGHYSHLVPAQ
ncbi:hypothetical protein SAICODRAFT_6960 [Saitoella complicata NRRL Y-17804]|uniref:Uncharacterized protein n=1 Tax=Saitoella complicata (strain BCRC 22490 / CBS 7301 / JCM 7358 / NBRC 10748 / NRRL Y-17804) TaxID=698492 RepID=A0A0E9NM00_SAICN|nr:uncharacterized protein SAICODRAFT_6960 [Saitoella complicata NRRL Y-17804]ODQ53712.1 hypothetical protein SAICODRAFT_6960 [Saitoella complicata NRRL Y-17804]GAO50892.1 hypothetical protein G7K_5011-t1 [Saitoella complicata NRRL Y-17804]